MGCAQSKIENEESVSRCKDRRNFMKEAVSARNAFAAGQSGYAVVLKNTGAALSDYAQGEADNNEEQNHHQADSGAPEPPMMEPSLPPPPPPLPSFSPVTPLQRSVTMPELPVSKSTGKMKNVAIAEDEDEESDGGVSEDIDLQRRRSRQGGVEASPSPARTPEPPPPPPGLKGMAWDYFFMVENMPGSSLNQHDDIEEQKDENDEEGFDEKLSGMNNVGETIGEVEPKTPEKPMAPERLDAEEEVTPVTNEKQFLHSNTAPSDFRRGSKSKAGSSANLMKILGAIDDHFLKASEAAQEVSKMLEATRMHYHSNFADNRGVVIES
ncbi:hypothetical protein U1Q18_018765 [Sarracenia purpurea var. burkii]